MNDDSSADRPSGTDRPSGADRPPGTDRPPVADQAAPGPSIDADLFAGLEATLLGQAPHLSRLDVIAQTGVTSERARDLWLSLGFPSPASDDEVLFTDEDVTAVRLLGDLVEGGIVDPRTEFALTRSMGRSFSRLAEWEIAEVAEMLVEHEVPLDMAEIEPIISRTLPTLSKLQEYVWRRHLANAAGRVLLNADTDAVVQCVGFADIVGYTRRTRSLSAEELAEMVERFESTVNTVISDHGGRIIKTIGDEVLFVVDEPTAGGRIGLALAGAHELDDEFPEVRVGMAHGRVLARLGDVFGETVNIASRLTSLARPGRVLADRELADALRDQETEFRVRRARTTPVKGYTRLETWSVKAPKAPRNP
ncbi:adenylate/guanylate cyclase domain-containing protein [Nocardioides sp. JQ2195]|uniref:adenylate/guanylate cyclase domain-containing protein n=1 Tax=Nocardioides sp. JQ2195 TaxID=2592334 RepID=UPI00143EEA39|nr:adenylate/guanylate cyclase domain-containing protein [Nocardioides sp. JQ2195]QIX25694.1 adenylate/guanylate cyclase domain-containing protein [Nocardioides sp. JQ2195]